MSIRTPAAIENSRTSRFPAKPLQSLHARDGESPPRPRARPTAPLRASAAELRRAREGRSRRSQHPAHALHGARPHLRVRNASPRSRPPAIRIAVPAATLRRAARLPGRDVHPHAAGSQGPARTRPVNLRHKIEQEIRERGPIPFSRYMELCLYDPEFGYYSRNAEKFGKAGDFYTSSDVHAVFGRLLARQFEEMWRALGKPEQIDVLELGPGRGLFAQDVLDWSEKKFPEFFRAVRYTLAERSASLRERLAATFRHRTADGKVVVLSEFGDSGFNNQSEDVPQNPTGGDARRSI